MTVLIKNGHVVDPLTKKDGVYDVLVEGKKIQKISAGGKKLCICTKYN